MPNNLDGGLHATLEPAIYHTRLVDADGRILVTDAGQPIAVRKDGVGKISCIMTVWEDGINKITCVLTPVILTD